MNELLRHARVLTALPKNRRDMLVVRSMPFGDIIEDDTRRVHIVASSCSEWRKWSYKLCLLAKRYGKTEEASG